MLDTVGVMVYEENRTGESSEVFMKSKSESKDNRKALIVTDKQLQIIKDACELFGRIQIGQFVQFAEIVTQTGFSGLTLRVQPKKNEDETDEQYKARCERLEEQDRLVCSALVGAITGIYREAYGWINKDRTNEADIALDVWSKLDGRRDDTDFSMSSEPLVQVKDWDGD